jgi:hypothetical protein
LLVLALVLCASAHGGYYYGGESHRRLQAKSGFGRELLVSGRHLHTCDLQRHWLFVLHLLQHPLLAATLSPCLG